MSSADTADVPGQQGAEWGAGGGGIKVPQTWDAAIVQDGQLWWFMTILGAPGTNVQHVKVKQVLTE